MTKLWAVYVQGPDDLIAVKSRGEGELLAKELEDHHARMVAAAPKEKRDLYPTIATQVVPWMDSPEGHAELLAEQEEEEKRFQSMMQKRKAEGR